MNLDELHALRELLPAPGFAFPSPPVWSSALSARVITVLLDDLISRTEADHAAQADTALLAECYSSHNFDDKRPAWRLMHRPTALWVNGRTEAEALTALRAKLAAGGYSEGPHPTGAHHDHH